MNTRGGADVPTPSVLTQRRQTIVPPAASFGDVAAALSFLPTLNDMIHKDDGEPHAGGRGHGARC